MMLGLTLAESKAFTLHGPNIHGPACPSPARAGVIASYLCKLWTGGRVTLCTLSMSTLSTHSHCSQISFFRTRQTSWFCYQSIQFVNYNVVFRYQKNTDLTKQRNKFYSSANTINQAADKRRKHATIMAYSQTNKPQISWH